MSTIQPATRWHFLDVLRATLLLIGVPHHAAMFFRADSPALDGMMSFTTQWRMPAFFVIAGFFAWLIIQRRGAGPWIRGRLMRLGIPLLFAVLILNPIQTLIISEWDWARAVDLWASTADAWLFHAWFLLHLLIYCAAFAAAWVTWGVPPGAYQRWEGHGRRAAHCPYSRRSGR